MARGLKIESARRSFKFVERKSPEIMAALAEAPIFKKHGRVKARPAVPGEVITTIFPGGKKETVNTAKLGDWVITNPTGESYIRPAKDIIERYDPTDEAGVYEARGYCRAMVNPFGQPIEIMASWGAHVRGDENCLIADTCDANGKLDGEPYLIDAHAFATTYQRVENEK